MNLCKYLERWGAHTCIKRNECLDTCRAGWLPSPVPCDHCGVLTSGPFMSPIHDDGDQDVFYRLVCPTCAPLVESLAASRLAGYRNVMWMTEVPVKER